MNDAFLDTARRVIRIEADAQSQLEAGLTNAGPDLTNQSLQAGHEAIGPIDLPGHFDATIGPDDYGAAFDSANGLPPPQAHALETGKERLYVTDGKKD